MYSNKGPKGHHSTYCCFRNQFTIFERLDNLLIGGVQILEAFKIQQRQQEISALVDKLKIELLNMNQSTLEVEQELEKRLQTLKQTMKVSED